MAEATLVNGADLYHIQRVIRRMPHASAYQIAGILALYRGMLVRQADRRTAIKRLILPHQSEQLADR